VKPTYSARVVDDLTAVGVTPSAGRRYWRTAVVLFVLAAASLLFAAFMWFTEAYVFGGRPDGSDVECGASSVTIVWGDGVEGVPEGYEDACRASAEEDIWIGGGAAVFAVAFGAAGVKVRRAARMPPLPAPADMSFADGRALSVPLGHGWSRARAELTSEAVTLVMPGILGRRRWTIPMAVITVVDPDGEAEDVVATRPLTIPRFYEAPAFSNRALTLLFETPRRVPPYRRIWAVGTGVSPRRTRSAAGVWADGVVLNFRQRPAVVAAFAQAGARATPSEPAWARAHGLPLSDPVKGWRRGRWYPLVSRVGVSLLAFIVLRPVGAFLERTDWALALAVVFMVVALAIVYLVPWLLRRRS